MSWAKHPHPLLWWWKRYGTHSLLWQKLSNASGHQGESHDTTSVIASYPGLIVRGRRKKSLVYMHCLPHTQVSKLNNYYWCVCVCVGVGDEVTNLVILIWRSCIMFHVITHVLTHTHHKQSIPFGLFWRQTTVGQSHVSFEVDSIQLSNEGGQALTLRVQQAGSKLIHETNFLLP